MIESRTSSQIPSEQPSPISTESLKFARRTYRRFMFRPGATRIASTFSLARLTQLIFELRPKRVLEIGSGIGTITESLLLHPAHIEKIVSIEDNDFCREQLKCNITDDSNRWTLLQNIEQAVAFKPYDIVIFDGKQFKGVEAFLAPGVVCFVDGNRQRTRDKINLLARERGLLLDVTDFTSSRHLTFRQSSKGFLGYAVRWVAHHCHVLRCRPLV